MTPPVNPEWWAKIFGPQYLEFYEPQFPPERTEAEVESLLTTFALHPPARILDIACGQGRHALALARRGFDVVGVDLSRYLLDVARTRSREAGLEIELVHADMRELPFAAEFDAAINLFTAFGYFEAEGEHERALRGFARALRPGGRLVLEMMNRDGLLRRFQPTAWQELPNGVVALDRNRFDPLHGRLTTQRTLRRPGQEPEDQSSSVRLFPSEELVRLFAVAGLDEVGLFEGFQPLDGRGPAPLRPYTPESLRICVTGRKAGSG